MDNSSLLHFDLNLLLSLHTLLEFKNVTHAAQALHISQPALSAQLVRLRKSFQDPLLIPSANGKGMVLTEKALALIEPLNILITQLHLIHDTEPAFNPELDQRIFRIAVSDSAVVSISNTIVQFLCDLPNGNIKIEFVHYVPQQINKQLEQDEINLVIDLENNLPDQLPSLLLIDEDFVLCFGKHHPIKTQESLSIEEYCSLQHVIVNTDDNSFSGYTDITLKGLGYKRNIQHSLSHFSVATEYLYKSQSVCTLPRHLVQQSNYPLDFLELPFTSPRYKLRMLWHSKKQNDPAIQWLRNKVYFLIKGQTISNNPSFNVMNIIRNHTGKKVSLLIHFYENYLYAWMYLKISVLASS